MAIKNIWIPSTKTEVTVDAKGNMTLIDRMEMKLQPISKNMGFGDGDRNA